jgi:hypothetical protein
MAERTEATMTSGFADAELMSTREGGGEEVET